MPYRIDYGHPSDKKYPVPTIRSHLLSLTAGAFTLFVLLTGTFWPEGREALRDLLIPGDPEITAEAFSTLVTEVREGEDLSEAVAAFCREIIFDGEDQN